MTAEIIKFKPRHEIECERAEPAKGGASNRAFWKGPDRDTDTAPCEMGQEDSGDCA